MNISRGAKCVATKRNNLVRKALPLFNDNVLRGMNLLTTPEEQQVRLERLHASGDRYVAYLMQQEQIRKDTAPILRAWAEAIMSDDLIERCVDGEIDDVDERLGARWLTSIQAAELAARQGERSAQKSAVTFDGRDWQFPQRMFLHWLKNRPKPGRKVKDGA